MERENRTTVKILDESGANWAIWKISYQAAMECKDLGNVLVAGNEPEAGETAHAKKAMKDWIVSNRRAKAWLATVVCENFMFLIVLDNEEVSVLEVLEALRQECIGSINLQYKDLKKQLESLTWETGGASELVSKARRIYAQLKAIGAPEDGKDQITERQVIELVLEALVKGGKQDWLSFVDNIRLETTMKVWVTVTLSELSLKVKDRVKLLQDAGIDRERSTGVSEATSFNATGRQCYCY